MEATQEKRERLVWDIERRLAEDGARPVIFYPRGGTCRQPWVKGLTIMISRIYNGWRYEDVWLDKQRFSGLATGQMLRSNEPQGHAAGGAEPAGN